MPDIIKKIGKYEIVSILGRGAMGVVYEAHDPVIDRYVAIKTQHLNLPDKELYRLDERFVTEARAVGRLNHPNIVALYDFGQDNECSYIVMELVRGSPLTAFVDRKLPITLGQIWDTILKVLDGLQYAHNLNIIHRDIKPPNILRSESGDVKITDFGIAQVDTSNLTVAGSVIGTPRYIPPERIKGKKGDHRIDIYSCGVVLHELLTGQLAFHDENSATTIYKLIHTELPPVSDLCPDCPQGMDEVVAKAVAKEPEDRFSTASEFADAIKKALDQPKAVIVETDSIATMEHQAPEDLPTGLSATSSSQETELAQPDAGSELRKSNVDTDSIATVLHQVPEDLPTGLSATSSSQETELAQPDAGSKLRKNNVDTDSIATVQHQAPEDLPTGLSVTSSSQETELAQPDAGSELRKSNVDTDSIATVQHQAPEDLPTRLSATSSSQETELTWPDTGSELSENTRPADERGSKKWLWILLLFILAIAIVLVLTLFPISGEAPLDENLLPADIAIEPAKEPVSTTDMELPARPTVVPKPEPISQPKPEAQTQPDSNLEPFSGIKVGTVFSECLDCPSMVVLPKGKFLLGSRQTREEQPIHPVEIAQPFAVARFEVSRGEFAKFASATGYVSEGCRTYENNEWLYREKHNWQSPGYAQDDTHPVVCISWTDASAYVSWLSEITGKEYRLLSSAEWEYLARLGHTQNEVVNDSLKDICRFANVADLSAQAKYPGWRVHDCEDRYVYTAPVNAPEIEANALGVSGLIGNAFEWVSDCWNAGYDGAPSDGSVRLTGDCTKRILRGGSWFSQPDYVRFGFLNRFDRSTKTSTFGFRVARGLRSNETIPTGEEQDK